MQQILKDMNKKKNCLLLIVLCLISLSVVAKNNLHMTKLHAEMLRLISTDERDHFTDVTEQLKTESQNAGDERMFYIAWGNQSTYEATHQDYVKADEIADKIADYAEKQNSHWGKYIVLHTKAVNALQNYILGSNSTHGVLSIWQV